MTETRPTKSEYGEEKLKEINITKLSSRCTPKRGRELDDLFGIESPSKRRSSKILTNLAAMITTILRLGCDTEIILPDETDTLKLDQQTYFACARRIGFIFCVVITLSRQMQSCSQTVNR